MKVKLERTVTDYVTHRRFNIYRREDGWYWMLATPLDPWTATDENVGESVHATLQEALGVVA